MRNRGGWTNSAGALTVPRWPPGWEVGLDPEGKEVGVGQVLLRRLDGIDWGDCKNSQYLVD